MTRVAGHRRGHPAGGVDGGTHPDAHAAGLTAELCALGGVAGPALFVLVSTIAGVLRPGYAPTRQMISDLGLGPSAWIQTLNFAASGLLLIAFASGFYHQMRPLIGGRARASCSVLLALAGAGLVNEAFFAEDRPGATRATVHGALHIVGFLVLFAALIGALFLCGRRLRRVPAWRGYGWYTTITGLVTVGLLIGFVYVGSHAHHLVGLMNRLLVVEALAWPVVIGYRLFVLARLRRGG